MSLLDRLPRLVVASACMLAMTLFAGCGDDDNGTGPSTSGPGDVTVRLTHMVVFGSCEGASGFDQVGDFIVEMQVQGPDGVALPLTPEPPSGGPSDLYEGAFRTIVPIDEEFVLAGDAANVSRLVLWFEVSERDGPDLFDDRMVGSRGAVDIVRNADGTWDGVTATVGVFGGTPCGVGFVVALAQ